MLLQIADNLTDLFTGYEDWLTKKDAKLAQISFFLPFLIMNVSEVAAALTQTVLVLVALLPSSWISAFIFYKL